MLSKGINLESLSFIGGVFNHVVCFWMFTRILGDDLLNLIFYVVIGERTTTKISYVSKTEDYHLPASAFLCRKFGGHPTPATQTINLRLQVKMFGLMLMLMIEVISWYGMIWGLYPMILQGFTMFQASQVVSQMSSACRCSGASQFREVKAMTHQLQRSASGLLQSQYHFFKVKTLIAINLSGLIPFFRWSQINLHFLLFAGWGEHSS